MKSDNAQKVNKLAVREERLKRSLMLAWLAVGSMLAVVLLVVLVQSHAKIRAAAGTSGDHTENAAAASLSSVAESGDGGTEGGSISRETGGDNGEASPESRTGDDGKLASESRAADSAGEPASGAAGESGTASAPAEAVSAAETPAPEAADPYKADGGRVLFADPAYTEEVTILSTGDNLIHEKLYQNAHRDDGSYDFTPMYTRVKPFIQAADIATVNMETPMASGEPSGYPHFNTPTAAGAALIDAGFDVMNAANNHMVDRGSTGLMETLQYWQSQGVPYVGAYMNADDMWTQRIIEVNGIKVAFLGFMTFTNQDDDHATSATYLSFDKSDQIESLVKDAKSKADVVVVHAHWWYEENTFEVFDEQKLFAQYLVNWGADVVFGNHSHTIEPIEILTRESDGKQCPVIYSMGNFVSGQKFRYNLLSGLMTVSFVKNPATGDVKASRVSFRPTVTHYTGDRDDVEIIPLVDYTEELAAVNGVQQFEEMVPLTMDYLYEILHAEIAEEYIEME